MTRFRFEAVEPGGALSQGVLEAADEASAIATLRRDGKLPIRAEPAGRRVSDWLHLELRRRGLRRQEVAELTRELSLMLGAGQDLDRALGFVVASATRPGARAVLAALRDAVRDGSGLAAAMARHPASFPPLYLGMIRAGEAGGAMADTLAHLATLLERERQLAATITSALIYPCLLTLAAIGSIVLLLTEVLPQFTPLFAQNGVALPLATRVMIDAGAFLGDWGPALLAGLAVAGLAMRAALRRPGPRLLADRAVLALPVVGRLAREVAAARFTRTLGTLLRNGVALVPALAVVERAIGNDAVAAAVARAAVEARGGASLARALAAAEVFPLRTVTLLQLGEETGQLGATALRAAEIHETEARTGITRLVSLLTPAITVIMGALIAGIVSSLLLAMLGLNDLAQ